jgi:hypothetical protein
MMKARLSPTQLHGPCLGLGTADRDLAAEAPRMTEMKLRFMPCT